MQFHNKIDLQMFAARKSEFDPETGDVNPADENDVVLNITDWEDGFIEILLEDGNTYYRFNHTDFERAVTAAKIKGIK